MTISLVTRHVFIALYVSCFLSAQAHAIFKVKQLGWLHEGREVKISYLQFSYGSYGHIYMEKIIQPKEDHVKLIGTYSDKKIISDFREINLFSFLEEDLYANYIVIQIGPLSYKTKKLLLDDTAVSNSTINTLFERFKKTRRITFDGRMYRTKEDFEQFKIAFNQKINDE